MNQKDKTDEEKKAYAEFIQFIENGHVNNTAKRAVKEGYDIRRMVMDSIRQRFPDTANLLSGITVDYTGKFTWVDDFFDLCDQSNSTLPH